jgi:hypothetical protein
MENVFSTLHRKNYVSNSRSNTVVLQANNYACVVLLLGVLCYVVNQFTDL